jgi:chromosomal replication initiation ATPase DnaA
MCNKIMEFVQCRNCPRIKSDGPEPGYYYKKVGNYTFIQECDCHKRWREDSAKEAEMIASNITYDFPFENYVGKKSLKELECLKKISRNPDFFRDKKMIYIWGPNGCQKTSMVQALGKELILKGYTVQYTLMSNLITNLVSDFSESDSAKEKKDYFIKRCMDCDFLIIDEAFDSKKITLYASGYQIPYLDTFLRTRFEINGKSIIFVSNVSPRNIADVPLSRNGEQVKQGFGTSIQNLIERNVKQSELLFQDVWVENVNKLDRTELFNQCQN